MNYKKIRHGSPDSIDKDYYVVIDKPLEKSVALELLRNISKKYDNSFNGNLICIDNGIVSWALKGTIDEVNNSIFTTYSFFKEEQEFDKCPVKRKVIRNRALKLTRTLRGILSTLSRTDYREEIKQALKEDNIAKKLEVLEKIDLTKINEFNKNKSNKDVYKFFAFQIGQTLALCDKDFEFFTKWDVAREYGDLFNFIYRKDKIDINILQNYLTKFINFTKENLIDSKVKGQAYYKTLNQTINILEEKELPLVYIFDIDNTLMSDEHRVYLREEKKWEEYFLACDKDKPIQCIIDILNEKKEQGYEIYLLTGRSDIAKEKTISSLKNAGVNYDFLRMRTAGVKIPDFVLKPSWAEKQIGIERVVAIYDDREQVIKAYEKKGFNVIDVKPIIEKNINNKFKP